MIVSRLGRMNWCHLLINQLCISSHVHMHYIFLLGRTTNLSAAHTIQVAFFPFRRIKYLIFLYPTQISQESGWNGPNPSKSASPSHASGLYHQGTPLSKLSMALPNSDQIVLHVKCSHVELHGQHETTMCSNISRKWTKSTRDRWLRGLSSVHL